MALSCFRFAIPPALFRQCPFGIIGTRHRHPLFSVAARAAEFAKVIVKEFPPRTLLGEQFRVLFYVLS